MTHTRSRTFRLQQGQICMQQKSLMNGYRPQYRAVSITLRLPHAGIW